MYHKRPFFACFYVYIQARVTHKERDGSLWAWGNKGVNFYSLLIINSLLTLVPTSVESERAFSTAGYIATEIRCPLSDSTLSQYFVFFLRSYFQNLPQSQTFKQVILKINSLLRYYFIFVDFHKKKKKINKKRVILCSFLIISK